MFSLNAQVTVVFDSEMQAVVVSEVLQDPVEVLAVDGYLVLRQREHEHLVGGMLAPPPAVEPCERKTFGSAVELSQDQAAVTVIRLAATRLAQWEKRAGREAAGLSLGIIYTSLDGHGEWAC